MRQFTCCLCLTALQVSILRFLIPTLYLFSQGTFSVAQETGTKKETEIWVGWLETPKESVRWVVRLQKGGGEISGTLTSPDRTDIPRELSNIRLTDNEWSFEVSNLDSGKAMTYSGTLESPDLVKGLWVQGESTVFSQLKKITELPTESKDTLGASSTWTDQILSGSDKIPYDLRLRIYSSGPFFDGKERVVLDSLANNLIGLPVTMDQEGANRFSFRVPALKVELRADLNVSGDKMTGILTTATNAKPIVLTKWRLDSKSSSAGMSPDRSEEKISPGNQKRDQSSPASTSKSKEEPTTDKVKIRMEPKTPEREPNQKEWSFDLTVRKKGNRRGDMDVHKLGCTVKLPENVGQKKVPVVIFASTFGNQDRDGTIGKFPIYKTLADWFASRGIASIRFDDRGVGTSTVPGPDSTTQSALLDLVAIIDYAKTLPEIDAKQVGVVGHGIGANLATSLAANDPVIAFLILLASPGINGSQLLLSESDRISQLEGLDPESRKIFLEVQREVHELAQRAIDDETQWKRDIDDLIKKIWPDLLNTMPENKTAEELLELRQSLQAKLLSDLTAFRSPFNREFLHADPAAQWMLYQCPTLAIWAEKDSQVVPESNVTELQKAAIRNPRSRITWALAANANHLFQRCESGHPSEYDTISTGIDPKVLDVIGAWLTEQGLGNQ